MGLRHLAGALGLAACALALTGCATSPETRMGDDATARVMAVLRSGPGASASLDGTDGLYMIPAGVLGAERAALLEELVAAPVRTPWFMVPQDRRTPEVTVVARHESVDRVIVYRRPRRLEVAYDGGARLVVGGDASGYTVVLSEDGIGGALRDRVDLEATPSLDSAWTDLERAARTAAVPATRLPHGRYTLVED